MVVVQFRPNRFWLRLEQGRTVVWRVEATHSLEPDHEEIDTPQLKEEHSLNLSTVNGTVNPFVLCE